MSSPLISACSGLMYAGVPTIWRCSVNSVLCVSSVFVALAMPKSITLGTGTPSCIVTSTFLGLMSRWMMPFWWACWIAWQTLVNRPSRARRVQLLGVAVLQDRHALDVLHDEVRTSVRGAAGIEHLGDVRMIHQRQRLTLRLEASDDPLGVHSELDDLERNASLDGHLLLGQPHRAEAALAYRFEELVWSMSGTRNSIRSSSSKSMPSLACIG